ncbi:hypothetical protein GCM10022244_61260 [Streptomyces gulbargensis]|uniref:Uncharacterized protein n=1 Tax=Streptomyces gulbargensis TaxID=364901 RepID=A0ABP7NG63_9ACTN
MRRTSSPSDGGSSRGGGSTEPYAPSAPGSSGLSANTPAAPASAVPVNAPVVPGSVNRPGSAPASLGVPHPDGAAPGVAPATPPAPAPPAPAVPAPPAPTAPAPDPPAPAVPGPGATVPGPVPAGPASVSVPVSAPPLAAGILPSRCGGTLASAGAGPSPAEVIGCAGTAGSPVGPL